MAERTGIAFISLQAEKVKKEIDNLINTYVNLAIEVERTKEFKGIKSDKSLSVQVNHILDQIKIVERKLKEINKKFLDLNLENFNRRIENFYRKAIDRTKKVKQKKEMEHKKFIEALKKWQEKAEKI